MPREPSHGFSSIGEIFLLTFPFIEQLGEAAFAQTATSDAPNGWGFGTVSAQVEFNVVANSIHTRPSNASGD